MPRVSRTLSALVLAASLIATPLAAAPRDVLQDGKDALKARRYDDAVAIFARGLEAAGDDVDRWQILLGLALANELRGDLPAAAMYYQTFLARSAEHPVAATGRWTERRRSALDDLAELEARILETHARLAIESEPAGASVRVEGRPHPPGAIPTALYLPAGQHTLELSLAGHLPLLVVVSIQAGQRITLARTLVPAPPVAPEPAAEPSPEAFPKPEPAEPSPVFSTETVEPARVASAPFLAPLGWSMVGLGGAALAGGIGLTAAAIATRDDLAALQDGPIDDVALARDASLRNQLTSLQSGAAALYAGGGALAAAGAVMLVLEATSAGPRERAQAVVGPGFVGVRGDF